MGRRSRIAVLTGALAVIGSAVAPAATSTDPKDVKSRLDIKSVAATASGGSIVLTVKTHKPFANSILGSAPTKQWLCVYLWKNTANPGRDESDFLPCARFKGGKLLAKVYSKAAGKNVNVGAKAARAGGNGIRLTVPASIFEEATGYYYLAATQDGGPKSFDIAPNAGPLLAPVPSR